MHQIINNSNREEWLRVRKSDVTASEVAALFGISPYMSKYELWHYKKGTVEAEFNSNERMEWGNLLEDTIAQAICGKYGYEIIKKGGLEYHRRTDLRMGATPDFIVRTKEGVETLLQVKNVDSLIFKNNWSSPDEGGEAPAYIETQLQHELAVTGIKNGIIGALVGGNKLVVYQRKSYQSVVDSLIKAVADFWKSIEENNPPQPDWMTDSEFVMRLYSSSTSGKSVELDPAVEILVDEYVTASNIEKNAKEQKDALKAQIITMIGDAEKAFGKSFKVSATTVAENKGTLITPEMVGQYYGARKEYRTFRVSKTKEKGE